MSKREKIIVAVMVLVLLIGGYMFLFTGESGSEQKTEDVMMREVEEVKQFANDITAGLMVEEKTPSDSPYIIARASAAWSSDPFLEQESVVAFEAEKAKKEMPEVSPEELGLVYSGYLTAGDNNLAVINGVEYGVGEKLDIPGDYLVKGITPVQVVIGREGSTSKIIIPLEETEF